MMHMSLLENIKSLLQIYRIRPNKNLGQNFMVEPSIFQRLSDYAFLGKNDVVLEIGSGLGFLTFFLANKSSQILAVEVDENLAVALTERISGLSNVQVLKGNIFKLKIPEFTKTVSIPPYQISSHLLTWLFERKFEVAVLILQKEFANRLVAPIGSKDYGWLSVLTYCYTKCELLDKVPKQLFYPQPKVDSVIVRLKSKQSAPFPIENKQMFAKLVRSLFTERNRKVKNALLPFLKGILMKKIEDTDNIAEITCFYNKRVRELAPEDFGALANALL